VERPALKGVSRHIAGLYTISDKPRRPFVWGVLPAQVVQKTPLRSVEPAARDISFAGWFLPSTQRAVKFALADL